MTDYQSVYNDRCDTVVITDGKVSMKIPFSELAEITERMREKHIERNNRRSEE